MILSKLKETSAAIDSKFPYGRTMLNAYLVKIGFQYQKADNRKSLWKVQDLLLGGTST